MLNYYLLSAVAMEKERVVYHSRCWIQHKQTGKKLLFLAAFRSKCLHVRYDFATSDPDEGNAVSLICGISKMSVYIFLPDIPVDHAAAKEMLARFICDPANKLALIAGHADKDEYGHFIVDGFDPIASALDGAGSGKRARTQRNLQHDSNGDSGESAVVKPKPKPKPKPKRKPKPKAKAKAIAKKPRIGSTSDEVRAIIVVGASHLHECCCLLPGYRASR